MIVHCKAVLTMAFEEGHQTFPCITLLTESLIEETFLSHSARDIVEPKRRLLLCCF